VFFSSLLLLSGCKGKMEPSVGTSPRKGGGPAAEAKQRIDPPVLEGSARVARLAREKMGKESTVAEKAEQAKKQKESVEEKESAPLGPRTPELPPVEQKEKAAALSDTPALSSLSASGITPPTDQPPVEPHQVPFQPKLVTAKTNIVLILDASGSMSAPFAASSSTKYEVLRKAVGEVMFEFIQQQKDFPRNIAIRVFGSESPADLGDCNDTKLLLPMGEPVLEAIEKTLSAIEPKGMSPLSVALEKSLSDFPAVKEEDRVIVLLSDGGDNCGADACAAAKKIDTSAQGYIINTVAFDIAQQDREQLECIAQSGGGKFFLARNESELRSALSDAVNSTVPYNLKLSAKAGATPIPFRLKVFRAGTQSVVKQDESMGTKLLNLPAGTYDLLIEYYASPEMSKPSKMLKGVEIIETTKVEQTVNFDLGQANFLALDNDGRPVAAKLEIIPLGPDGPSGPPAILDIEAQSTPVFLTPQSYDIMANLAEVTPEGFSINEKNVAVTLGESKDVTFRFQKGSLLLTGVTTQEEKISFVYQVYKAGRPDLPIANGAFDSSGGTVLLPPGTYEIIAIGTDPKMAASPRTRIKELEIKSAEVKELPIRFEMGTLKISAVDGKDNKIPAEFTIREKEDSTAIAKARSESGDPVMLSLPPGTYDIVAVSLKSELEPRPSVPVQNVEVAATKPTEQVIKFILGTLKLRGRNAKEIPIKTQFTIYRAASDEVVSNAPPTSDWVVFDLAPGVYDALAIDIASATGTKPMIWLRDLKVEDGKSSSHEAIYTTGKLKIIGRGPNNKIITCKFKVFEYGADREIISGVTGDDWEIFEIDPGKYYLEASYKDEDLSVVLKKWINIDIGDNEVVEQILRF